MLFGGARGRHPDRRANRAASDRVALELLLDAWNTGDSYATRVAAIRAGTGGVPKLGSTTVFDDGVRDDLFGGPGLDWYLRPRADAIHGQKPDEQVN